MWLKMQQKAKRSLLMWWIKGINRTKADSSLISISFQSRSFSGNHRCLWAFQNTQVCFSTIRTMFFFCFIPWNTQQPHRRTNIKAWNVKTHPTVCLDQVWMWTMYESTPGACRRRSLPLHDVNLLLYCAEITEVSLQGSKFKQRQHLIKDRAFCNGELPERKLIVAS